MYNRKQERGQALIVLALAIVGLAGIVGLVVDGGNAFADRRSAQNAADSAALAAAVIRIRGDQNFVDAAMASASKNGYDNNGATNTVQVHSPPISGPNQGNIEYIQVVIVSHVQTYFARVVGVQQITNTVEATSRSKLPEITEILNGAAVISLAPTSECEKEHKRSFWVHGEATLDITGGGVFVNSNNPTCAFMSFGSGSIRIRDDNQIMVVGGASIQKPHLLTPGVTVGASQIPYPPPFFMPKVGCGNKIAQVSEDGTRMSDGAWDDEFPPPGVTDLESGVYCLNDGFVVTGGTLRGNNVTFVVDQGEVRFAGSADIQINAPNNGNNAGLLIYVPIENNSKVVLNGGTEAVFKGTILAPGSRIIINGNSSTTGFHSQIIGYTVEADGNSNVVIIYNDEQNYDALTMPEVQFSE